MKRIMAISGVLIILISLASCGNGKNIIDVDNSFGSTNLSRDNQRDGKKQGELANGSTSDLQAGVIAKSGNAVSSDDKEEVIKQLDKELDSLFESINESKGVSENEIGQD
ncbi:MAG TPA: hypothetical protein VHT34_13810 [Clostridia bacterium]|nr:hypothetical protein [Clostridia bacterium]